MNKTNDIKASQKESFKRALSYYLSISGKTQSDLCNDLNLTSSTVSEWYTGKRIPRSDRVQLLADYLHAPMEQFLNFKEPLPENNIDVLYTALKDNENFREFAKIANKLSSEDLFLLKTLALKILK